MLLLYVMAGGAFGALMRYLATEWLQGATDTPFPYGTLAVNVVGCFLLGAWVATAASIMPKGKEMHMLIAVGALGGFTTFSAFAYDIILMADKGLWMQAAAYIAASVGVSLIAMLGGMFLLRAIVM